MLSHVGVGLTSSSVNDHGEASGAPSNQGKTLVPSGVDGRSGRVDLDVRNPAVNQ
jgi:hypothetical protein